MNKTSKLRALGQSVWLDNITRDLLDNGTMCRYIAEYSVTGLTSNPTIFDEAIGKTTAYDAGIRDKAKAGRSGEALFIELALEDLRRAADLFRPVFDATEGVDGWISMEISPRLPADTAGSVAAAHRSIDRPTGATCSSRFPGHPRAFLRSRNRSLPAYRSTSRSCSRGNTTSRPPRLICARSSVGSPRDAIRG